MTTDTNAVMASELDPSTLADLNKAGAVGDTFSVADLPASQRAPVGPVAPAADPALSGMIAGALVVTFNLLAKQRGDHWALDADSANEAGTAYAVVVAKYFPNIQGGPEFTAVLLTVALLAPRIMVDKANAAVQAEQEKKADGAQPE